MSETEVRNKPFVFCGPGRRPGKVRSVGRELLRRSEPMDPCGGPGPSHLRVAEHGGGPRSHQTRRGGLCRPDSDSALRARRGGAMGLTGPVVLKDPRPQGKLLDPVKTPGERNGNTKFTGSSSELCLKSSDSWPKLLRGPRNWCRRK